MAAESQAWWRGFDWRWGFVLLGIITLSCSARERSGQEDEGRESTVSQALCTEARLTVVGEWTYMRASCSCSSLVNAYAQHTSLETLRKGHPHG